MLIKMLDNKVKYKVLTVLCDCRKFKMKITFFQDISINVNEEITKDNSQTGQDWITGIGDTMALRLQKNM